MARTQKTHKKERFNSWLCFGEQFIMARSNMCELLQNLFQFLWLFLVQQMMMMMMEQHLATHKSIQWYRRLAFNNTV